MTETNPSVEPLNFDELREAKRRVATIKSGLQHKLGQLVGATIDISGYPHNALYEVNTKDGRPQKERPLRALPCYPIFSEEPIEPRPMNNRSIDNFDGKYIWVSSQEVGASEREVHPDAIGKVVAYTFDIDSIIDLKVQETPEAGQQQTA